MRDLYGVVLSENANKGIIITNSSFSKKAIEFADGKNLELIDGSTLTELLEQYKMDATNETTRDYRKSFYEMGSFESDKYLYLKSRIESNRNEKQNYESLRKFLIINTRSRLDLKSPIWNFIISYLLHQDKRHYSITIIEPTSTITVRCLTLILIKFLIKY